MKKRNPTTCPVVFSLDLFGDKWSLVILRDLLLNGKSHFREFLNSDEKISSNILSNRLELLMSEGFLVKQSDPNNKSATIYKPTKKTLDLLPMLFELIRWGVDYNPTVDKSDPELQTFLSNPKSFHKKVINKFSS